MMALARAYLLANWKQLAGVAAAFGVVGYAVHRCPEAMHLAEAEQTQATTKAATDTTARDGPKKKAGINFDPAPGAPASVVIVPGIGPITVPAGERIEAVDVEEDAGSEIETHGVAETQSSATRTLDLTVTPASPPGWAVGVGVEDLLGARTLRLSARRRLLGPFWAEAAVQPATRTLGVGLAVEW